MSLIYKNLLMCILVIIYSVTGVIHSCYSSTNIALGKPYTVFPLPNCPQTAPPTDNTSLTNGEYTVGYFWTNKTTAGWQHEKTVEILIDLEEVSIIGSIIFSTARGKAAGVYYPLHIAAFVGPDKEHMLYVGDIAATQENQSGEYQTKRFSLDGIGVKGRYVQLEIQPKGSFLFCDEIEVIEGSQDKRKSSNLSQESTRSLLESLKRFGIYEEFGFFRNKVERNLLRSIFIINFKWLRVLKLVESHGLRVGEQQKAQDFFKMKKYGAEKSAKPLLIRCCKSLLIIMLIKQGNMSIVHFIST